MQKVIMLLIGILIIFVPIAVADQGDEVEKFTWDGQYVDEFKKVDIPVYVPSSVASSETLRKLGRLFVSKHKKAYIWKDNDWEYLVWADNTNNAINIIKRVMATIPKGTNPVHGAIKGQLTTIDTNEGVRSDAGWSYDNGETWYIVTGRNSPEQLVKVLKSMAKLDTK